MALAVTVGFIALNVLYFSGDQNPDWHGYRLIFDSGAWLSYQQRDVGFLNLILLFKTFVSDNYETFRIAVGAYFIAYSALFIWIMERRGGQVAQRPFLRYLGLLPLSIILFTTEIRAGMAITVVLLALALVQHPRTTRRLDRGLLLATSIGLLGVASSIHLGTAVFLAMMLVAIGLAVLQDRLRIRPAYVTVIGVCLTIITLGTLFFNGQLDRVVAQYGDEVFGTSVRDAAQAPIEKVAYWLFTCLILVYVIRKISAVAGQPDLNQVFATLVRYAGFAVLPVLQALVLVLLLTGSPGLIVSAAIRMYELVLFTFLALISFRVGGTWPFPAVVAFFLVNDYRVLSAALGP